MKKTTLTSMEFYEEFEVGSRIEKYLKENPGFKVVECLVEHTLKPQEKVENNNWVFRVVYQGKR